MEQVIEVVHVSGAWCVRVDGCLEPMLFLSGGRAERAARRLACSFAGCGCEVRVFVHDTRNALIGSHRYFAA